ncbi:hypothetical protein DC522_16970 [Microvirga sp. KLBC 81]|uniref:DUF6680 family protein n=1 Tax=Microvirga sp. KLBC 81 TaxID=1862707 RepID=UPI000D51AB78|nr:DUF6680 family protein [Microvirga sp. KLBC 81]PVE23176.1 hypothetical protein DC522_16970 [Microvirga sp. KLBC 81]
MDASIKLADLAIVFATLLGPILAIQAQKMIERATEAKRRKLEVFHTLMATRATRLAPEHVQALNRIDIEFVDTSRRENARNKPVVDAYRIYLDKLSERAEQTEAAIRLWNQTCDELFIELLFAMSQRLGYTFDKVQLKRGIYHPQGHSETELIQNEIRDNYLRIISGQQPLAVRFINSSNAA